MKTILKYLLVALMLLACETAKGQGIKIMDLPILSSPDSSIDWIPTSHYGTTYRVKIGKLFHEFGGGGGSTGWALNGNTVGSEKFIGTLDNFAFPVRVNNAEIWSWETNNTIQRGGVVHSVAVDVLQNTSWGYNALQSSTAAENTAMGYGALSSAVGGARLTAVGNRAGESNVSGGSSNYLGYLSGGAHTGSYSDFIGEVAGGLVGAGNAFVAVGARSLMDENATVGITGGSYVTALGANSGQRGTNASVSNSTYLGSQTISEGSNEAVIGGKGNTNFYFGAGRFGTGASTTLYDITMRPTSPATGSTFYGNQTDANGINWNFGVSQPTGTGTAGDIIWQFAPTVQSSGTTQNALSTGITFKGTTGSLILSSTLGAFTPNILTTTQRNALTASDGMVIYNSTDGEFNLRESGAWETIGGGGGGSGTVTSIATTSPITGGTITTTGTIGINDALADGSTKGAASFSASDFGASSGNISIDYINGQKAAADATQFGFSSFTAADFNSSFGVISLDYTNAQSASTSTKGFLTDTDWDTFNDKLAATGTMTGATTQRQDFTNGIGTGLIDDDATSEVIFTISTVQKASLDATGFGLIDGAAANPSYSWSNDKTTGFYLKTATSELGAAVNGSLVGGFNTSGLFTNTISEQTAAAGVTIDGVLLKDGLVLGQYGGTGVNNSGKTITLGGNLTTSGAHATTFTTTGTTGVTLPTSGTLATLAGTETFTNKSIVATQLTGTAYTIAANNTNATAAYTLEAYENHPLATYAGTIDFNGTDPATIISQQYRWSKVAGFVTLTLNVLYTTPGTTNTSATFTLPSDCPAPVVIANSGDAASEYMYPICGARVEANQTANPSAVRGGIRQNASNNGYEIVLIFGSVSALSASFTIIYPIN